MGKAYLECRILPGLFDSEYYVLVNGSNSFYVTKSDVIPKGTPQHGAEVSGKVLAYVIERRADRSLVELPGEPVVGGLRTWVPNKLLAAV